MRTRGGSPSSEIDTLVIPEIRVHRARSLPPARRLVFFPPADCLLRLNYANAGYRRARSSCIAYRVASPLRQTPTRGCRVNDKLRVKLRVLGIKGENGSPMRASYRNAITPYNLHLYFRSARSDRVDVNALRNNYNADRVHRSQKRRKYRCRSFVDRCAQ